MKYNNSEREIPAYKKKAKNTGLPRSKHKHVYETVLLTSDYHHTDLRTGAPKVTHNFTPTKVCAICGRVDSRDNDPEYYIIREVPTSLPFVFHSKEFPRRRHAESASQIGLSTSDCAKKHNVVVLCDVIAACQPRDLRLV